jgi:ligand-binding sensor domain-containing protein
MPVQLWFATSREIQSGRKTLQQPNAGSAPIISNAFSTKNSTVWIGGNNGTIAFYKDSTWTIQSISTDSHITSLAEDSSGNLWIGTNNGLIKKTEAKETVFTISDGLGHNIVNTVFVDNNNRVWVGTHNGLSCFEDGVLKQTYLRPYGIAGNYISSICQNKDDVLWTGQTEHQHIDL